MTESETVDHLIYRISHDFSASVRALVELPKWITEDLSEAQINLPSEVQEHLEAMNTNGRRLDRMVNDLVLYSRVGRFQQSVTVDAAETVTEICESITLPPTIDLELQLTNSPFTFAQPDFSRLCQALISNAVKHADTKTTRIRVAISYKNGDLALVVDDDGPGIPPEHLEKAQEIFTTLQSRDLVEGSGIGLALAQKIAENYNGHMQLNLSEFGRGLSAKVTFLVNDAPNFTIN